MSLSASRVPQPVGLVAPPESGAAREAPIETSEHPAVSHWRRAGNVAGRVAGISVLKESPKSGVFRLSIDDPRGSVVAKRSRIEASRVERDAYEQVLPQAGLRSVGYYGFTEEEAGDFGWIFLEDAGDETILVKAFRDHLAHWLGCCHGKGGVLARLHLPHRGVEGYLDHLRAGRDRLKEAAAGRWLPVADRPVMKRLIRKCDRLESRWKSVEERCDSIPRTLVHGDVALKHMRVVKDGEDEHLLMLDWEIAGWGSPVPDLERLNPRRDRTGDTVMIDRYISANSECRLSRAGLADLARTGAMLRILAGIDWATQSLSPQGPDDPLWKLRAFEQHLSIITP